MINAFSQYVDTFMHPIAERTDETRVSFYELLGISWIMQMIYGFYSLMAIYIGSRAYQYVNSEISLEDMFAQDLSFTFQKYNIFSILFQLIIYPFLFQFGFKFWSYFLNFFGELYGANQTETYKQKVDDLVTSIFSTNLLLVLPVIGNFLSMLVSAYYLFIGATKKLGFSKLQALILLITPIILISLMTTLVIAYYTFVIRLIFL